MPLIALPRASTVWGVLKSNTGMKSSGPKWAFSARLHRDSRLYLDRYFLDSRSHSEQIAKFLSILELMKVHVVALLEPDPDETDAGCVVDLADHVALILKNEPDAELLEALTEYA